MDDQSDLGCRRKKGAFDDEATAPGGRTARGLVLTGVGSLLYLLWLLFGGASESCLQAVGDVMGLVAASASFVWSLKGRRKEGPKMGDWRASVAPNLLSLGLASYTAAEGVWTYSELVSHTSPFPSPADVGYIGAIVCFLGGLVLSPSRPIPATMRMRVLLDSLMTTGAIVTFSWYFALGPAVLAAKGTTLAKSLATAYPLLDLAMLFCVVVLSAHPFEKQTKPVRNILCVGVLAYVASDVAFAFLSLQDGYHTCAANVGWVVANLLIGQGVCHMRRTAGQGREKPMPKDDLFGESGRSFGLWRSLTPYALLPTVGILVYYVWRSRADGNLAGGVYLCAAVLVALLLARQVFAIVENTRLYRFVHEAYREMEAAATTDGMTGLPNHRAFQERLRSEVEAARLSGLPLALMLLDVDRFKQYNDSFGHPAGDDALRIVARLLRESLRTNDLPARYGGEEFVVVLPETTEAEAAIVAERIRAACEAWSFPCRSVTLSIGVVEGCGADAGGMIERADRALYAAKRGGRNRVERAGTPSSEDRRVAEDRRVTEESVVLCLVESIGKASGEERAA